MVYSVNSIFEVDLLSLLSHDAMLTAEDEAVGTGIAHQLLGFQKWDWHAKITP